MEKDEEYRIVEEESPKQKPEEIVVVIKTRKKQTPQKLLLLEKIDLNFFRNSQNIEGFVGFFGTEKRTAFQVFAKNFDDKGHELIPKKYPFASFKELLESFFEGNMVSSYDTNVVDTFVYLTTPIKTKDGINSYPNLEMGFIGPEDPRYEPKVFVNVYENQHQIVKNVEFSKFNDVCKEINKKRMPKQHKKEDLSQGANK